MRARKRGVVRKGALLFCVMFAAAACDRTPSAPSAPAVTVEAPAPIAETESVLSELREILSVYRKIIVLLAEEKTLGAAERAAANRVGHTLFHANLQRQVQLDETLAQLISSRNAGRFAVLESVLGYIESGEGLYDADRLAFREVLRSLERVLAADGTLPAIKLHKRINEDLEALAEIERNYDKELKQIFSRFESRAIELKRERWDDYVANLKKTLSRPQILAEFGEVLPPAAPETAQARPAPRNEGREIFGSSMPPKTVLLTFDDGPHRSYTDEIAAILRQYDAPAVFFHVGRNLGSIGKDGQTRLGPLADVSRRLKAGGHVLANHSYSHAQLSKQSSDALKAEISSADALLKEIDPDRSALFRFPYGARNDQGLNMLELLQLRSMMWSIDSLDWADPVPNSIADRVLKAVEKDGRGIILFHDIHERTVRALPKIIERLAADGYRFAGWDGKNFTLPTRGVAAADKVAVTAAYANSWAIVIGIDEYQRWPKLQSAVNDAQAIRKTLIDNFGFAGERVFLLTNKDATRNGILALFHDKLGHGALKKDDRLFVFFAGHGATRKLSSGRELGYIVPVDSNPEQFATDAIPMTEIQNIAESLDAKHVLFVMDACYSGLGLTRGAAGGSKNFLKDNARRVGRQMLTAGGADQLVADSGPGGHSVFTWTLLQALGGKGDLNGDGLMTATELAAYVAPAVSGISRQTPAFGSLPGSEGGEFVLELKGESEFLSPQTAQLGTEAIAMNTRLDEQLARQTANAVTIKDLQGKERTLEVPQPLVVSPRQLAQRANDRGLQLFREKQYAAAEQQFLEALKQRPDFALAANNLGFVYYRQEKFAEAVRWFEQTLKIDPSRAIAYVNLGDAYAKLADVERAKKAYRTYLELAPKGSNAQYVLEQLGRL